MQCRGLRLSAFDSNDLANAIAAIAKELTGNVSAVNSPGVDVEVEGVRRNLKPVVRDEAYRIAVEAMRNAFRHAHATRILVEIRYDDRQFCLTVRDDGKGVVVETIQREPSGHFGLHGMRERAELLGGKLEVWSKLGSGTQIELSIPGAIAYELSSQRAWWSRLLSRNGLKKGISHD
jgi:signal transduction histidine kinase